MKRVQFRVKQEVVTTFVATVPSDVNEENLIETLDAFIATAEVADIQVEEMNYLGGTLFELIGKVDG